MKSFVPFAALAMIAALSAVQAQAQRAITPQARTANDLADLCAANPKDPQGDAKINFCHGYAQGAIAVELRNAGDKKLFCFPSPPPTRTQTLSEFVSWVRSLPEHRNETALDGLFKFLAERYPCK
jgi:Rap1a immunity proteins